ncbi:MAG: hypothetical protein NTW52_17195 [Planctomycetota bacterium]|nr:hypothetical protein [Planctomycetota bacterium]
MIKDLRQELSSSKEKPIRSPAMKKVDGSKTVPFAESPAQVVEAVVSKYPATSLAGGFVFGGLIGWLLKR